MAPDPGRWNTLLLRRLLSGLKIPSSQVPIHLKFANEIFPYGIKKEESLFQKFLLAGDGKVRNVLYKDKLSNVELVKPVPLGRHLTARFEGTENTVILHASGTEFARKEKCTESSPLMFELTTEASKAESRLNDFFTFLIYLDFNCDLIHVEEIKFTKSSNIFRPIAFLFRSEIDGDSQCSSEYLSLTA